ncbi:MAG: hypothetical protein P9X24_18675 [Candidatus Hatepunaea meridiana]|nr:hypothetical protein [Candidatus Hatepunaea meridiana]
MNDIKLTSVVLSLIVAVSVPVSVGWTLLSDNNVVGRTLLSDNNVVGRTLLSDNNVVGRTLLSDNNVVGRTLLSDKDGVRQECPTYPSDEETNLPLGGGWVEMVAVVPDSFIIHIDDPWVLVNSIIILLNDSLLKHDVDYFRNDSLRTIEILPKSSILPGTKLLLKYQSAAILDTLVFQRFHPFIEDSVSDSSTVINPKHYKRYLKPFDKWRGLRRSGSITRGIRFDQDGTGGVTSGLHLELSGRPTTGVKIDAILDDRDMPASASGASASLAELDRLLFQVRTPHLFARLGDWDIDWKNGRYGSFSRRLKGGNVAVEYPRWRGEIAAAGGNNAYMTTRFNGRDGDQGPYELTDKLNRPGIVVVSGSERVYLNGELLKRGRRADYVIDYAHGGITFNPKCSIRSDSRIEVEYEYNDQGYPRYFYAVDLKTHGTSGYARTLLSGLIPGFTIEAFTAMEGRDTEHPLTFEWTDPWRDIANSAGDDHLKAYVSGIDSVGIGLGDYIWEVIGVDSILVFSQPDSLGRPTGYLRVEFSRQPGGGYRREYDADLHAYYFQFAGVDSGDWVPVQYLPLPDKVSLTAVNTTYRNGALRITGEAAISNYDRNTLSTLDDDDNTGTALNWRCYWNQADNDMLALTASVRREDSKFHSLSQAADVDRQYKWDLTEDTTFTETEIEAGINLKPYQFLKLSADGGYLERGNLFDGQRYRFNADWDLPFLILASQYNRTEGDYPLADKKSVRTNYSGKAARKQGMWRPSYLFKYEKREISGSPYETGYKRLEHETGLGIIPSQRQEVNLIFAYRSDDNLIKKNSDHQSDTRSVKGSWRGRGHRWGGWYVDLLRYYQTFTDTLQPVVSTSAALQTTVSPPNSQWNLRVDYGLSTGSDRAGAQIASYVGEGNGSYRREENRYVPDPDGDFDLHEVVTDTLHQVSRVNFTGQIRWNPRKRKHQGTQPETYPLGITGLNSRFEADINTTSDDPWQAFLLYPPEFRTSEVVFARRTWLEELYFLEGDPVGDGKLSFRRSVDRDRTLSGGEEAILDRISFRLRLRSGLGLRLQITPSYQHNLRKGITTGETRSDVNGLGSDFLLTFRQPQGNIEYSMTYGFEQREDRTSEITVKEQRINPRLIWTIGHKGTARFEGGWRGLTSSAESPGYDLTQSWAVGNNWTLDVGFDYNLSTHVMATAYYRGLWRGDNRPRNSGLIEFTAKL